MPTNNSNAVVQIGPVDKMPSGKALVHGVLGGTFGKDEVELMRGWAEGFEQTVKDAANKIDRSVCALLDIRTLQSYDDPEVVTIITELLRSDNPFIYKTATYGGSTLHEMLQRIMLSMAGRPTNLRNFKTEEEAINWLKD